MDTWHGNRRVLPPERGKQLSDHHAVEAIGQTPRAPLDSITWLLFPSSFRSSPCKIKKAPGAQPRGGYGARLRRDIHRDDFEEIVADVQFVNFIFRLVFESVAATKGVRNTGL